LYLQVAWLVAVVIIHTPINLHTQIQIHIHIQIQIQIHTYRNVC